MTAPPPPEEITDPAVLKALAHPLRQRILGILRQGPASATTLAKELGENTGATSYHLRELAKHGFIEEEPGLGRGKERWWRTRPRDLRFPRRGEQSVPNDGGTAGFQAGGSAAALSGFTGQSAKGVQRTSGIQLLFYVPGVGTGESEQIRLLGWSESLIGASEIP